MKVLGTICITVTDAEHCNNKIHMYEGGTVEYAIMKMLI